MNNNTTPSLRERIEGLAWTTPERVAGASPAYGYQEGYKDCKADILALLGEGEEEPISEYWLLGLGGKSRGYLCVSFFTTPHCEPLEIRGTESGNWFAFYAGVCLPQTYSTRDSLLALFNALGIALGTPPMGK